MASSKRRDDFPESVKLALRDRVGGLCSRPDCRVLTIGPRLDSTKAKSVGRACHIHAAAPLGPRFSADQTPAERASYENGIWLCAIHAAEIDADEVRFPAEMLWRWKRDAEEHADRLFGRSTVAGGPFAKRGHFAIGPEVICCARFVRSSRGSWTLEVEDFLLGGLEQLRRFTDEFDDLPQEDRFVCSESDGVGRMLVDGPIIEHRSGLTIELALAAPLPRTEARALYDANDLHEDIAIDLSEDLPELDFSRTQSGTDRIAPTLMALLSTCKGGHTIDSDAGSRVAEFIERLGAHRAESIIALETIRLATVPHQDSFLKQTYILFGFIERVRGVRLLPTVSPDFIRAGLLLDVHGVDGTHEYVVPISTSTEPLREPPPLPSKFVLPPPR